MLAIWGDFFRVSSNADGRALKLARRLLAPNITSVTELGRDLTVGSQNKLCGRVICNHPV